MFLAFSTTILILATGSGYTQSNAAFTVDTTRIKSLEVGFQSMYTEDDTLNYSFLWQFGDGTTSDLPAATHLYPAAGSYTVVFTVEGPVDTAVSQTVIQIKNVLEIPNVFTPNNDGLNDFFAVRTDGITEYSLKIFSRKGYLLTKLHGTSLVWDGKLPSGQKASPGIYYYILSDHIGMVKSGFFYLYY